MLWDCTLKKLYIYIYIYNNNKTKQTERARRKVKEWLQLKNWNIEVEERTSRIQPMYFTLLTCWLTSKSFHLGCESREDKQNDCEQIVIGNKIVSEDNYTSLVIFNYS